MPSQDTYSDLTQDIGSGHVKQRFVIQAQQLGQRFQHRLHAEDFLVQDEIVGGSLMFV